MTLDPRTAPLRDSLSGRVLTGTDNVSYHLRDCIGEGGQGWVFRANWDDPSGHVVIVKVLRPDVVGGETLRRFQREAEVLRMLSTQGRPNPYIVRFYDHAIANVPSPVGLEPIPLPFTVLEYVDGTTLESVLKESRGKGLGAERVRRLTRQICQALDIVHAQKVVHRDLKPSNILLANEAGNEVAKVTDFGLVKLVDMNLQRTTALAGASLGYAPPEQYEQGNQRVSPRTDIFSLAAVTFEALAGKPAFPFVDGENPLLIVTRILNGVRPSLAKNRATLAPELASKPALMEALDRELEKALAADPNARHASAMEFWNAIEKTLRAAGEDVAPPPRSVSPFETTARLDNPPPRNVNVRVSPLPPASTAPMMKPFGGPKPAAVPQFGSGEHRFADVAKAGSGEHRVPEGNPAVPASWTWHNLSGPLGPAAVRSAVFAPGGERAIVLTANGLLRWERGAYGSVHVMVPINPQLLRGMRWLPGGSFLAFGAGGFVALISPAGHVQRWMVPDTEVTFHGALVEDSGLTTLVGERPYRGTAVRPVSGPTAGVVAQFTGDRLTVMSDAIGTTSLRAAARMQGPNGALIACGDWGTIARVELGVVEHLGSICGGHLLALATLPDGSAVTVGAGGHALSLSPKLEATLEAVQTTRDLLSLSLTDDGTAWSGSAQARVLRRSAGPNPTWVRMNGSSPVSTSMLAIAAGARTVRAIGDDGTVVEGRIA